MSVTHSRAETEFVARAFNEGCVLRVPSWQRLPGGKTAGEVESDRKPWSPGQDCRGGYPYDYEPERCHSMAKWLRCGDVLFDIGVSDGWLSALYAIIVGPKSMCLFEPSSVMWPTIRATWEANGLRPPKATFCGFLGDKVKNDPKPCVGAWPAEAESENLIDEPEFRTLKEREADLPQTTVDDFVEKTGIVPRGLSIDVEGAELLVLRGAKKTLVEKRPLVWLSLHTVNGAIFYDYGHSFDDVLHLMSECVYKLPRFLELSGDEHWFFEPI